MRCGNVARLVFFIHVCGWYGVTPAAGETPVVNVTSEHVMPPSDDGDNGDYDVALREVDDRYVYVQRRSNVNYQYKIDVRTLFLSGRMFGGMKHER